MSEKMPGGTLFADRKKDPSVHEQFQRAIALLENAKESINPMICEALEDERLFRALPESIKNSDQLLAELLLHSGKFDSLVSQERHTTNGLFGEDCAISKTTHADGRVRRAESGKKINVDYLKTVGIDPAKVLFFRTTQPSVTPKPEYYWTSDFLETQRGLQQEIAGEKRKTAVTLVANLEIINQNGGLIEDINDDQGLSVRQINENGFDQNQAIAILQPRNS